MRNLSLLWQPKAAANTLILKEQASIVDQHDPQNLNRKKRRDWGKIDATQIRHITTDRTVKRLKHTLQAVPNLRNQWLADVQDLKADQPAHNEMCKDEEPCDAKQKHQDLEDRLHGA
jgi:hypothetical protein